MTAPTCAATVKNLKPGHLYRYVKKHLYMFLLLLPSMFYTSYLPWCFEVSLEHCLFVRFEVYAINKEGESPPVQVTSQPNIFIIFFFISFSSCFCSNSSMVFVSVRASEGRGSLQAPKRAQGAWWDHKNRCNLTHLSLKGIKIKILITFKGAW